MAKSTVGFIGGLGQVRLTLELTPRPGPTGGDVLAIAILTSERRDAPVRGQRIAFYLGPDEMASEETEDDGRASYTFGGLGLGTHAISVQVAGIHVTDRHAFSTPPERMGRVEPPLVRAEGDEGAYIISLSAVSTEGGPARGIPVRLLVSPSGAAPSVVDQHTDDNGFLRYDLRFDQDECDVTVQMLGYEVKIENLHGKTRIPRPRRYQRPSDAELLRRGFWGVVCEALRRGAEDAKGG